MACSCDLVATPTARSTIIAGQKQRDDIEPHVSRFDMHDSAIATTCFVESGTRTILG
jgi:hypothetical protein